MGMEISRKDIVRIYGGILAIQGSKEKYSQKFTYALGRNKRILEPIIDSIKEMENEVLGDYCKEIEELYSKYATLDTKGRPEVIDGKMHIEDDKFQDYIRAKEEIDNKWKDGLKENQQFLNEKEKVRFFLVDNSNFPDMNGKLSDDILTHLL